MPKYICPDPLGAEMSMQESARFPLLFLFGLFGLGGVFTKSCKVYSSDLSRISPLPSTAVRAENRFLVEVGAMVNE